MPNAGSLQSFSATRIDDAQTQFAVHTGSSTATRVYFERWNQADNTFGGQFYTEQSGGSSMMIYYTVVDGAANRRLYWRARGWRPDGGTGFGPYIYSNAIQTTPRTPVNVSVSLTGPLDATVYWNDGCYEPYYEYQTQIWWNVDGGGWGQVATVGAGSTSANFPNLSSGSSYQFLVKHVETTNGLGSADVVAGTVVAQTVPATPGAITATRSNDSTATLSWTNSPTANAPYNSLTLQRWDNVGNAWATIANLGGGATSTTDSALVAGRKYQWRIVANNGVGSSGWAYSGNVFTTPSAPSNVVGSYVGGTTIRATWTNNSSYSEYGVRVQAYKDGVADGAVVSLNTGTTSYDKTGVVGTSTYYFKVWAVSDVGALASTQVQSNNITPAAAPNAPTNLAASPGPVLDKTRTHSISWLHNASTDGSAQTKYQIQHRLVGSGTWTVGSIITSTASTAANPFSSYSNGQNVEWQVRTYGIHANPSPFSATSTVQLSTVPTVTITGPATTINTSRITAAWSYFDAESTAQSEWKVDLLDATTGNLLESKSGTGTTSSLLLDYEAADKASYRLEVTVRDASGLWSDKGVKTFSTAFTPPSEVLLSAAMDAPSGSAILTMAALPNDGGVTTFPPTSVTIERQFWDEETETYSDWEVLAYKVPHTLTLIDTTAPAHDDGQYRITAHSDAPSSYRRPATYTKPPPIDNRWLYVSGGPKFEVVCKMWANIEISQSASRTKALHYFAGRKNPVIFSGESAERTYTIAGILEDEASPPQQWMRLARQEGPVLLRAPGRRMYGSLSEVTVDRIQNGLHKVSFSIQEVAP